MTPTAETVWSIIGVLFFFGLVYLALRLMYKYGSGRSAERLRALVKKYEEWRSKK